MIAVSDFQRHFENAYSNAKSQTDGNLSTDLPVLSKADAGMFVAHALLQDPQTRHWHAFHLGDVDAITTAQSVSKVVNEAVARTQLGTTYKNVMGSSVSDCGYNDAVIDDTQRPINGMINFGAIANCVLLHQALTRATPYIDAETHILGYWKRITGDEIRIDDDVYRQDLACAEAGAYTMHTETFMGCNEGGRRLREIWSKHGITISQANIDAGLTLFLRLCSLQVTVKHLAQLAVVFRNNGCRHDTEPPERIFSTEVVEAVNDSMVKAGLYGASKRVAESTGGFPCKSGISGALIAHNADAAPAFALAAYSPRLSPEGNSVQGVALLQHFAQLMPHASEHTIV